MALRLRNSISAFPLLACGFGTERRPGRRANAEVGGEVGTAIALPRWLWQDPLAEVPSL
jgi:hypothetical protein